jgi:hypothetical protein
MLEERPLRAVDVNDAVREAAFGHWPIGAQFCRIADLNGQEIASVGRVRPVGPPDRSHRFEQLGEALEGGDRLGGLGAVMVEEGLSSEAKALRTRLCSGRRR